MASEHDGLLGKFSMLRGLFSEYHANVERSRRFYEREFLDEVLPTDDDSVWAFIPPTARRAIDEPADHILPFPKMRVPVRPTEGDPLEQEDVAERKRQFMTAWWRNIVDRYNPIGDGRKLMLMEGRLCVKKSIKWDLIPDYPKRENYKTRQGYRTARANFQKAMARVGHFDFLWETEVLDTMRVYEDPSDHRDPQYVFIENEIYVEEARRLFPDSANDDLTPSGNWRVRDDFQTVTYLEYWSKPKHKFDGTWEPGQRVHWINDRLERAEDNPYPYIPIAIEDAGFGRVYKNAKPHEKYVGIAQHVLDTFVAQARQYTSWQNVTEVTAFAPTVTRNMDATKPIVVGPKAIIALDGGPEDPNRETIEFLQWPALPIEVIQLAQRTEQIVDESVKMNALGGIAIKGVETATEADQQIRNAASKLSGPVGGLERIANKLSAWALMDVDVVIEYPVTVFGNGEDGSGDEEVTLAPADIRGFYRVNAALTTTDEYEASLNKARFWLDAYQRSPFLSAITAMTKGDVADNPLEEMVMRSAEDVFLSPEMTGIRKLTGAQAFGQFAMMFKQLAEGGGGAVPGAGTPTGGSPMPMEMSEDPRMNTWNRAQMQRDQDMSNAEYGRA